MSEQVFEPGTPEWRDNQERLFEDLIEKPESWQFSVTDEQKQRVSDAYEAYRHLDADKAPDISAIRQLVVHQFTLPAEAGDEGPVMDILSMEKFWRNFSSDIPEPLQRHQGLKQELQFVWIDKKIAFILKEMGKTYMEWEEQEVVLLLKSPDNLRRVADELDQLETDGYRLYHLENKGDSAQYNLRRGKVVAPEGVTPLNAVPAE